MSSVRDIAKSNYLKKEDVGKGVLWTIESVSEVDIAFEGQPENLRFLLKFKEHGKSLVLNSTNAQIIALLTGIEDEIEAKWPGHRLVLYTDPSVSFGGKLTGGIRIRGEKDPKEDLPF